MNLLIVEDVSYVAEMLRRALEELGNTCLLAHNTTRADELLSEQPVDGVTLDLCLPGRGGLSWLEGLATTHPELARKTLVITGQSLTADSMERLARCGAGVLAKPFTLEHLEDALRSQVGRPVGQVPTRCRD